MNDSFVCLSKKKDNKIKKHKILLFILFSCFLLSFSQAETTFFRDVDSVFTIENITKATFEKTDNPINNGLANGIYWIKVPKVNTGKTSIQITNNRIQQAIAYQDGKEIDIAKSERFLTFETDKKATIYIKVNATREAFIPLHISSSQAFIKNEKKNLLFSAFYYGFAMVVFLINVFYFINFKENTFLFYAFFLFFISFGFIISDGFLYFFELKENTINVFEVIDHFLVVLLGSLFANSFLQIENYYTISKKIILSLIGSIFIFGIVFLITNHHIWYVVFEILIFSILSYYWIISCVLFRKNIFTKIFAFAYFFILFLGICFYVTKLIAIPITISANKLKIGGYLEMIILSFMVVYRMKFLKNENEKNRLAIEDYLKQISSLSNELALNKKGEENVLKKYNLSHRENEVLELISLGKTNKMIAEELFISINTVKTHIKNIYEKLNVKSRKEIKIRFNNF